MKNKKQILIILGLIILVIIFIIVYALFNQGNTNVGSSQITPTLLTATTAPLEINPGTAFVELVQEGENQVAVQIDSGPGTISAVQLSLSYDPRILTNVRIQKGKYFPTPFELLNMVDENKGIITYAIGIAPNGSAQAGKGTVAIITYTPNQGVTNQTRIDFLPQTKVTSEGINTSVLQQPHGLTLNL
jgi:hypothetical protein